MTSLLAFSLFGLGIGEMMVVGVIGVLLFGKKLPDVGRSLAKTIRGFQQGMSGLENDVDGMNTHTPTHANTSSTHIQPAPSEAIRPPQRVTATAPKFEDTPAAPPQV